MWCSSISTKSFNSVYKEGSLAVISKALRPVRQSQRTTTLGIWLSISYFNKLGWHWGILKNARIRTRPIGEDWTIRKINFKYFFVTMWPPNIFWFELILGKQKIRIWTTIILFLAKHLFDLGDVLKCQTREIL